MEEMLTEALDAGFVGMSAQQLIFDKLDGDVCRSRTLPSTYARRRELKPLRDQLRAPRARAAGRPRRQAPAVAIEPGASARSARRRAPLKTSLLSAADIKAIPFVVHLMGGDGQAGEPARRRLPLAAPAGAVRGLRRRHRPGDLRGVRLRRRRAAPPGEGRARRPAPRRGVPRPVPQGLRVEVRPARLAPRLLRRRHRRVPRRLGDRQVVRPGRRRARHAGSPVHPVDAFLDLVLEHGTTVRWRTTISNHRPKVLRKMAQNPGRPDRLLRRRGAPAQHGLLQLRAAAAQARGHGRAGRHARS